MTVTTLTFLFLSVTLALEHGDMKGLVMFVVVVSLSYVN